MDVTGGSDNSSKEGDLPSMASKLNINAPVFVPSFLPQSNSPSGSEKSPVTESPTKSDEPLVRNLSNTKLPVDDNTIDNWEDNCDDDENFSKEPDVNGADGQDEIVEEKISSKKKSKRKEAELEDNGPKKGHLNIVFIGHVDAGKSTIGGQLLYITGMVDKRTLEKYEQQAREKNRESWYLSWALDTNDEERDKGKTVEVGRAYFETETKRFTLLDAPGHRGFVPNMISGASQADVAVLVISARRGEFETGFEKGGQTREHVVLAKTSGIKTLIVLINKMDDPTVDWSQERYNECKDKLLPFLKRCSFNPKDIYFMPCSGLKGSCLKELPPEATCPWFRGPTFLDFLDKLPPVERFLNRPFRLPVVDRYKDMGTVVMGKVESGSARKGSNLMLMPNRKIVEILQLWSDDEEVNEVQSGENVKIKLKGIEEEEVSPGFVLCDPLKPCRVGKVFDAKVRILEHKSIIAPGYTAILHLHTAVEEISVKRVLCLLDEKTKEKKPSSFIKQDQLGVMSMEVVDGAICLETYNDFPRMGMFIIRDEGKTIGIGRIVKVRE